MSRLQIKCYTASAGVHLLLLVVLLVGPAFFVAPPKDEYRTDMQLLTFVPMMTTDRDASGGGNPNAAPPPPAPEITPPAPPAPRQPDPPPPPAPEPPRARPPEPPPQVRPDPQRPPSPEPDVTNVRPERALPRVNLTLTERRTTPDTSRAEQQREAARERAARERERQIASAVSGLRQNLSGRTEVGVFGPGGGGPTYANFRQTVMTVYFNAWDPPPGIAEDKAITHASVTIARDGRVVTARITKPSGNAAVDASVRRALDRVKFVAPLPAESREAERTVPLVFDLTAKRDQG